MPQQAEKQQTQRKRYRIIRLLKYIPWSLVVLGLRGLWLLIIWALHHV